MSFAAQAGNFILLAGYAAQLLYSAYFQKPKRGGSDLRATAAPANHTAAAVGADTEHDHSHALPAHAPTTSRTVILAQRFLHLTMAVVTTAGAFTLAFAWRVTIGNRSIIILMAAAVTGAMGVLGNVVGWAWTERKFGPEMLPALAGGMAVAGLAPSLVSLIMNPAHHARFGLDVFYSIAAIFTIVGGLAFCLLEYHPRLQRQEKLAWPAKEQSVQPFNRKLRPTDEDHGLLEPLLAAGGSQRPPASPTVTPSLHSKETAVMNNIGQQHVQEPLDPAFDGTFDPARRSRAVTSFYLRMVTIAFMASVIFGWQPSLLPYLIPNGSLVAFQLAGQVRRRLLEE